MEGRKTKYGILKEVVHYTLTTMIVVLAIVAYGFKANISDFFAQDLTKIELLNNVLHFVPTLILTIQIIVLACVVNFILSMLSKISFGLTDKTKTIINLINNLLKWVVIIGAILWVLSVWGVNTTTLLAGAGILALVIGLGAQSLIADILAGISIVLEGKFVVGDIVVIDGWRGKIVSIGIRTTELEDVGGNIKIVNNSEIKSVINQTKMKSVASCTINISTALPFEKVEQFLINALPAIKNNIPAITDDIVYKGITKVSDITIELMFNAQCYEEDLYQVQRDLNRQFKLLLDAKHIESFAPPTYIIDENKNKQ